MHDGPASHCQRQRSPGGKIIRHDPSPMDDSVSGACAERAGLLNQFRRWLSTPPREGRRARRHAAQTYLVWLGWWQGEHEFFALTARLANISRGGALVV